MASKKTGSKKTGSKAASRVSRVGEIIVDKLNPPREVDRQTLVRRSELLGVVTLFLAVCFLAALVTFDTADLELLEGGSLPHDQGRDEAVGNWFGPVGVRIADKLFELFGLGAYALVVWLGSVGVLTLIGRSVVPTVRTSLGAIGLSAGSLMLTYLGLAPLGLRPYGHEPAGWVGMVLALSFKTFISTLGATLLAITLSALSLSALTKRPLVRLLALYLGAKGKRIGGSAAGRVAEHVQATKEQWRERRESRAAIKQAEHDAKREAVAELQALEEDAQPKTWSPDTGLMHGDELEVEAQPTIGLPDTRPSGILPQAEVDQEVALLGTPMRPSEDMIPANVRRVSQQREGLVDGLQGPDDLGLDRAAPTRAPTPSPQEHLAASFDDQTSPDHRIPTEIRDAAATPGLPRAANAARGGSEAGPQLSQPAADFSLAEEDERIAESERHPTAPLPVLDMESAKAVVTAAPPRDASPETEQGAASPRIIKTAALQDPEVSATKPQQGKLAIGDRPDWKLPPHFLVQKPPQRAFAADSAILYENAKVLEQKLEDFSINGQVTDIRPGPVVTTYEYKPAPGVKISKIVGLKDDLTMSLSAQRVRVVAPIPGRDVVGIEVPNKQRQIVYFHEVLTSEGYVTSKSKLPLVLGKDIEGNPVVTDLAKAPHLLVAGATGTGKSVGINSFIASMLFKASPEDVKFIMIDPKVLELSIYEGIPHLLLPPIDDPHKAELALKWAVREMERRYRVLAGAKVRSIAGYQAKLPELRENARKKRVKVVDGKKKLVDATSPGAEHLSPPEPPEEMPYIVVVIDEFADLIMASGKEVERAVARLAQKARACGIHVILATQRPSTDVLTGMIKANFPTRVSFQVASSIDSKVVVNSPGAENLLGMGDLLFLPPGSSHLQRCHGTWITDEEVAMLAEHWKGQGSPDYDLSILVDPEAEAVAPVELENLDARYDEAVEIVAESGQVSVSMLQRKMGIGYGRSARIVDQMEAQGLIGPSRGPNKPREVFIDSGHLTDGGAGPNLGQETPPLSA